MPSPYRMAAIAWSRWSVRERASMVRSDRVWQIDDYKPIGCIACGRPMEQKRGFGSVSILGCPEQCTILVRRALGYRYYEDREAIRMRQSYPDERIREALGHG